MDASGMNPATAQAFEGMMQAKQMKDFMSLYTNLVERCFNSCTHEFTSKALSSKEVSSLVRGRSAGTGGLERGLVRRGEGGEGWRLEMSKGRGRRQGGKFGAPRSLEGVGERSSLFFPFFLPCFLSVSDSGGSAKDGTDERELGSRREVGSPLFWSGLWLFLSLSFGFSGRYQGWGGARIDSTSGRPVYEGRRSLHSLVGRSTFSGFIRRARKARRKGGDQLSGRSTFRRGWARRSRSES
ncbi:hypothetical protein BCR35DRAFT_201305 [Leucosporidium creatinivorum]|uniref:Mitochondrial import inner membrane translocase subunit TIM9 n=1 Tax=Leucosporidium creatinivorum TaxID=106004 RepID=A0A1Y2DJS0_9BASI|nr:hypothetical protein BCR35DRAFT_201305 [Leucosporidium creatinivorum]